MKKPITTNIIKIDGVSYTVISHYVGNRELTAAVRQLAEKQAYDDIKIKKDKCKCNSFETA